MTAQNSPISESLTNEYYVSFSALLSNLGYSGDSQGHFYGIAGVHWTTLVGLCIASRENRRECILAAQTVSWGIADPVRVAHLNGFTVCAGDRSITECHKKSPNDWLRLSELCIVDGKVRW